MSSHPRARSDGIVIEEVGDELVIYVQATQTAHALSADAAAVWRCCDGRRSAIDIASVVGLDQARVARALDELSGAGLIEEPEGISRRALYKRMAKLGAAAVSAPLIYSVAIPAASAAQSPTCGSFAGNACVIQWSNATCTGPQLNDSCMLQTGSAGCTCQNLLLFCVNFIPGSLWGRAGTCA